MAAMAFIGVTTSQSMINRLFPLWAKELDLPDAELRGIDLPVDSAPDAYRRVIEAVRDDRVLAGALVTTHKLAVFESAGDVFAELDPDAQRCREISCIVRDGAGLVGYAKDPTTVALALDLLLPDGYFAESGGYVLCLGAGGAGTALALCLLTRELRAGRPQRIVLADVKTERLRAVRALVDGLPGADVDTVALTEPDAADRLLAGMPAGSLIANATGLGKDRPGSPIDDAARFPADAIAWDFNYRGDLQFLRQAGRQPGVRAEDGWDYFLHGWIEHITEIYRRPNSPALFQRLSNIAAPFRP